MRVKVAGKVSARVVDNIARKAEMIARTAVNNVPNRDVRTPANRRNKREDPFVPNPPKDGGGG